jgi:hypothetical protein
MDTYFEYKTKSKLSSADKQNILHETAQLQRSRSWWVAPLFFSATTVSGKPTSEDFMALFRQQSSKDTYSLTGRSKVFLVAYGQSDGRTVTVNTDEDVLMTYRDMRFIIEQLCEWSRLYNLEWEVSCEQDLGGISGGVCDTKIYSYLQGLIRKTKLENSDELAFTIDQKYASRNEW